MVNAVHHARTINGQIRRAKAMDESELYDYAKELQVSAIKNLLKYGQNTSSSVIFLKLLPVMNFAANESKLKLEVSILNPPTNNQPLSFFQI